MVGRHSGTADRKVARIAQRQALFEAARLSLACKQARPLLCRLCSVRLDLLCFVSWVKPRNEGQVLFVFEKNVFTSAWLIINFQL